MLINRDLGATNSDSTCRQGQTCPTTVIALADTGCQSCLAGSNLLSKLGATTSDLIPVRTKMRSASNEGIRLLGAILLKLSGSDENGHSTSTNQMTYITDCSETFFLSRGACVDLGIISDSFPTIGEAFTGSMSSSAIESAITATKTTSNIAPCGCPKRTLPPSPPQPPLPLTDSNRLQLEKFLLDFYASSTFNTCPHQPLPQMTGPPMKLMIDPKAIPVAHHKATPVPLHFYEKVKEDLDRDVNLGVLGVVPPNTPTEWCHRMVVCSKQDGTPRRTVDFQALNKYACRDTHHTPSPFHLARSVPHNMLKTVLDAWNGYHSVPIEEADYIITTFITPFGRYWYKVAPQGYLASGDAYTRRYDAIIADIKDKVKCVDDTLLWASDIKESFMKTIQYLELCGQNGIILNPTKFKFACDEVDFAGFNITLTNVRPCNRYLQAIQNYPTPRNLTDIRSWFGLVNQVSYTFSKAKVMEPFRVLLKPDSKFEWTDSLDQAFKNSKTTIVKEIEDGVKIFDKSRITCLSTDWSRSGIGFWLLQKHCTCPGSKPFCCHSGWKVALVGSRFTNTAESRYAPVEGEALAVVYALEKARHFVLGCSDLTIAVDHKPLLKLFGDRALEDIPNPRLRNLKEKTLRYRFRMVHVPGAKNKVADGLSRHPADPADEINLSYDMAAMLEHDDSLSLDVEKCTIAAALASFQSSPITATTWDLVRSATASDESLNTLLNLIETGFPISSSDIPQDLRIYFPFRDLLSTVDGVIIYKDRVVIPQSLRANVLSTLHSAHQGTSTMTARAESSVFWPGITKDIQEVRDMCYQCNRNAPSNPSPPPTPTLLPEYPFQCVCADYFQYKGVSYLIIVDRYSNWPVVEKSADGAKGLVSSLKKVFTTFGVSEELASDGGTEFTSSTTNEFLKNFGVHHRLSSVALAQSNGRAEVGVKTMKRLLMDNTGPGGDLNNDKFQRAIMQYRNTPDRDTGLSPSMSVFGRHMRDFIPVLPQKYRPHRTWIDSLDSREEALRIRHMRAQERLSEHTRRLPPLKVGDHVRIQNQIGPHPLKWDKTGVIVEVRQYDQYMVKTDGSNRTTLRNRKFLRHFIPAKVMPPFRSIMDDFKYQTMNHKQPPPHVHDLPATKVSPDVPLANIPAPVMPSNPVNTEETQPLVQPAIEVPSTNEPQDSPQSIVPEPSEGCTLRRSSRISFPPSRLSYQTMGKPNCS